MLEAPARRRGNKTADHACRCPTRYEEIIGNSGGERNQQAHSVFLTHAPHARPPRDCGVSCTDRPFFQSHPAATQRSLSLPQRLIKIPHKIPNRDVWRKTVNPQNPRTQGRQGRSEKATHSPIVWTFSRASTDWHAPRMQKLLKKCSRAGRDGLRAPARGK